MSVVLIHTITILNNDVACDKNAKGLSDPKT